ncbi:hypothetical protein ACNKHR_15350 [Shigella flexneri]
MALLAGISPPVWSYTGMASIRYMTGEIKNPGKTMPRALIGSCLLVLVLHPAGAGDFRPDALRELANSETPISDASPPPSPHLAAPLGSLLPSRR